MINLLFLCVPEFMFSVNMHVLRSVAIFCMSSAVPRLLCSHFQTSVSVFRLEVLRCLRPSSLRIFSQTTADLSPDKALFVFSCAQATLSLSKITTCREMYVYLFFFLLSTSAHLEETFRDRVHVGLAPGFSLFSHHTGHHIQTLHDNFCFLFPTIYLNSQLHIQTYLVSPLPSQNLLDVIHYSLSTSSFSFAMSISLFHCWNIRRLLATLTENHISIFLSWTNIDTLIRILFPLK